MTARQPALKVISLGWGVQSFTLAAMVALGELEPVDFAIHADTTHEASWTYDFARRWTPWLVAHGVNIVTVCNESNPIIWPGDNGVVVPAYILGKGIANRQCTFAWKIAPMRRWLQANRNTAPVEQWLGISLDEFQRMRDSEVKYIANRYPLIEKKMTRANCVHWLGEHDLEIPAKSACVFCPFHSTADWRKIKNSGNGDWQKAIAGDEEIRKTYPPYDLFVHPSRKPLEEVDLRTESEKGQLSLWDQECSGICGV